MRTEDVNRENRGVCFTEMTSTIKRPVLRVLVACEKSGRVRDAFRARGHDAWSCDLLPSETPGPHFQSDVRAVLDRGWDLMIAHPPCTYLASSGMHWTVRGMRDWQHSVDALSFIKTLWGAPIKHVAIENPVGILATHWQPSSQIIHPWMFGSDASKATCLWLRNLPPLRPNRILPPVGWVHVNAFNPRAPSGTRLHLSRKFGVLFGCFLEPGESPPPMRWRNQRPDGQVFFDKDSESRSRTWPGVAAAMAEQWGAFLESLRFPGQTPRESAAAGARGNRLPDIWVHSRASRGVKQPVSLPAAAWI